MFGHAPYMLAVLGSDSNTAAPKATPTPAACTLKKKRQSPLKAAAMAALLQHNAAHASTARCADVCVHVCVCVWFVCVRVCVCACVHVHECVSKSRQARRDGRATRCSGAQVRGMGRWGACQAVLSMSRRGGRACAHHDAHGGPPAAPAAFSRQPWQRDSGGRQGNGAAMARALVHARAKAAGQPRQHHHSQGDHPTWASLFRRRWKRSSCSWRS